MMFVRDVLRSSLEIILNYHHFKAATFYRMNLKITFCIINLERMKKNNRELRWNREIRKRNWKANDWKREGMACCCWSVIIFSAFKLKFSDDSLEFNWGERDLFAGDHWVYFELEFDLSWMQDERWGMANGAGRRQSNAIWVLNDTII